jgi:hypothetical protein
LYQEGRDIALDHDSDVPLSPFYLGPNFSPKILKTKATNSTVDNNGPDDSAVNHNTTGMVISIPEVRDSRSPINKKETPGRRYVFIYIYIYFV